MTRRRDRRASDRPSRCASGSSRRSSSTSSARGRHALAEERLQGWMRPSNWYLTGFLIPSGTPPEQSADADEDDDFERGPGVGGPRRGVERGAQGREEGLLPLLDGAELPRRRRRRDALTVTVRWGDYAHGGDRGRGRQDRSRSGSARRARQTVAVALAGAQRAGRRTTSRTPAASSSTSSSARSPRRISTEHIPPGTRSVSVFLVNHRSRAGQDEPDLAYAFQPELEVRSEQPFVPRPDLRGAQARGLGRAGRRPPLRRHARVRDRPRRLGRVGDRRRRVPRAAHGWIPSAEVEKTETVRRSRASSSRWRRSARSPTAPPPRRRSRRSSSAYREWIDDAARRASASLAGTRRETARSCCASPASPRTASSAASRCSPRTRTPRRLPRGEPRRRARAPAAARASRRRAGARSSSPSSCSTCRASPTRAIRDRETVDLLFFPTGGGKTEAYLGLAAFTMVLRRLRHPGDDGLAGAGVSVIMRYTLRLLTLDQLARAAGLVCALELEREQDADALRRVAVRDRPLGRARRRRRTSSGARATGDRTRRAPRCGSSRTTRKGKPSPIPLENCPWCGTRFEPDSFALLPERRPAARAAHRLHELRVRLHAATARCRSSPWTSRSTGGSRPS